MKRVKLAALACVALACAALVLAGCQSQSYTPPSKEPTVSSAALGTPGTLRVGVNASSAPLAGQTSSSSHIVGIDVDTAAYLADQMGLKLEVVDVSNEPAKALSEGKVDVVLGVDASEDTGDFWKSEPYIRTGVALFGTAAETAVPTVDSKPQIAVQASSKSSWRVTNLFEGTKPVVENDLKSAFDDMEKGTVRYVAADAVIGTYVAYTNGFDDKIVALLQDPSGYCAAVSKSNTELQSAVASAIQKLVSGGMMDIIESKWLGGPLDLANTTVVKSAADEKKSSTKKDDEKDKKKDESSDDKKDESSDDKKSDDSADTGSTDEAATADEGAATDEGEVTYDDTATDEGEVTYDDAATDDQTEGE